jgi:hypothetical protein
MSKYRVKLKHTTITCETVEVEVLHESQAESAAIKQITVPELDPKRGEYRVTRVLDITEVKENLAIG